MSQKTKPKFVAISDIHFNEKNLELSSKALSAALNKAEELKVPLVIAGDLHDTKAIIRAEVANRLVDILGEQPCSVHVYILMGNHDMINEKGDTHSLNYLRPYATVVDFPCKFDELPGVLFIPYQNKPANIPSILKQKASKGDILVMHQGTTGSNMGDYIQDKSAIDVSCIKNYIAISGHYHQHQTVGTLTYIGNPFTMSFGEANDGPKGFLVVNEDGSFTREILNFRKHIILDQSVDDYIGPAYSNFSKDLIWMKLRGSKSKLDLVSKYDIAKMIGHSNFKLDKIAIDSEDLVSQEKPRTDHETLDALIDTLSETQDIKLKLKKVWRDLIT